jgi:hypothetical protein
MEGGKVERKYRGNYDGIDVIDCSLKFSLSKEKKWKISQIAL